MYVLSPARVDLHLAQYLGTQISHFVPRLRDRIPYGVQAVRIQRFIEGVVVLDHAMFHKSALYSLTNDPYQ